MKIFTVSSALILLASVRESHIVESFSTKDAVTGRSMAVPTADKSGSKTRNHFVAASSLFSTVGEQQKGGPPGSIPTDGRPSGLPGGPPGSGPPRGPPGGGPPGGGPPPQTKAQKLLEQGLEVAFKLLYLGDEVGLKDSSKNLRVLWTRSILNRLEKIDDPIAFDLLPKKSRWVANVAAEYLPKSIIEKLDWIVQRTDFIDGQLKSFLEDTESTSGERQVLVLGSGYDTRCLRYGDLPGLSFYCVDLPSVASNFGKVVERYQMDIDASGSKGVPKTPTFIPQDLNEIGGEEGKKSLLETLSNAGFVTDGSVPTMVLCEAVLFYLTPASAQHITSELFSLRQSRYCLTDNLSKVGVIPGGGPEGPPPIAARARCEKWLSSQNKDLVDHDSIWGGAIHFVGARETSS